LSGRRSPGDGWRRAVERLEAAMNALMSGDANAIKALYSHRDDVTAFFGWGGYEKGWAEVSFHLRDGRVRGIEWNFGSAE
jgi:hypothetical protein